MSGATEHENGQLVAQNTDSSAQTVQLVVQDMIKIETSRLDRLADLIGALVIAESTESQAGKVAGNDSHERGMLRSIMRELHDVGMSLRMVPLRPVLQKMGRLVRDLARQTGKEIRFELSGEDTKLDKSMIDQLSDPLVHLIRYTVHHGLEASAEERRTANKPETACIQLRAFHKGGYVHIELEYDGKPIDQDAILARALQKGYIHATHSRNERDVHRLLFLPGVLLDTSVPADSPRQIRLDLVKHEIEALKGQYHLSSLNGKHMVFSVRVPLTITIIDGMVLRAGNERYVIPTLAIVVSIRPTQSEISTVLNKGQMLSLHGTLLPLFHLSKLFDIAGTIADPTRAIVIVVEDDGQRVGIVVDELLGQQQIVIKEIRDCQKTTGIAGAAIMADGAVGLILDVKAIVQMSHNR